MIDTESVVAAAADVRAALRGLSVMDERVGDVASAVGRLRGEGVAYRDILEAGHGSLLELATTKLDTLQEANRRLRKEMARALHVEGVPMDRIGSLLGVTRQRVSMLVRS